MAAGKPYSVQKLVHHPVALDKLRRREHQNPTVIHFMPELRCPHSCSFCAYGHRIPSDGPDQYGWKNMQLADEGDSLPKRKAEELVDDWEAMGVKAIELTGGGEPLVWPHVDWFFQRMARTQIDTALVTNGAALTEQRAHLFASTRWKWARVSIDAGNVEDYTRTHRAGPLAWDWAWKAVDRLVRARQVGSEQRVGAGFVVDKTNWTGIYEFLVRAKDSGADNVRISMAFTPAGLSRLPDAALPFVTAQIQAAREELECDTFKVNSLFGERCLNLQARAQDYEFCAAKEYLCVVGGDQRVYSCCTLAFNENGLIGSIRDQSFRDLWWAPETLAWFQKHDAREACQVECLYEARNKRALGLMDMNPEEVAALAKADQSIHRNFI